MTKVLIENIYFLYEYQIYSIKCVEAQMKFLIFSTWTHEMKYFRYLPRKGKFSFYVFCLGEMMGKKNAKK